MKRWYFVLRSDFTILQARWDEDTERYHFSYVPTAARSKASRFEDKETAEYFARKAKKEGETQELQVVSFESS